MSALFEQVRIEASQLSAEEKKILAIELIDSAWGDTEPKVDVEAAWNLEIAKRIAEVRSGEVQIIPWETVQADFAKKFGWAK